MLDKWFDKLFNKIWNSISDNQPLALFVAGSVTQKLNQFGG